jgi:uncharacterized protein YjbI with pentapeptide repeats
MTVEEILDALRATTPKDLLREYQAGQRDFSGVNLLRTELRPAVTPGPPPDCVESAGARSPLWEDRCVWRHFDWDSYGRCASADFGDSWPEPVLAGSVLSHITLAGSYMWPVNLASTDLSHANLRGAVFIDCDLSGARLFKTDFRGAFLRSCKLSGADLSKARFERATLEFCDLRDCNLDGTVFSLARFRGVDLRGTRIESVRCASLTLAGGVQITTEQLHLLLRKLGIFVQEVP